MRVNEGEDRAALALPSRRAPYPDSWRPYLEQSALFHALIYQYGSRDTRADGSLDYYPAMELQLDQPLETAHGVGSHVVLALMSGRSPTAEQYRALAARLSAYAVQRGVPFLGMGEVLGEAGRPHQQP